MQALERRSRSRGKSWLAFPWLRATRPKQQNRAKSNQRARDRLPPREGARVLFSHQSTSRTWRRAVKAPAVALEARAEAMVREKLGKEKRLERRKFLRGSSKGSEDENASRSRFSFFVRFFSFPRSRPSLNTFFLFFFFFSSSPSGLLCSSLARLRFRSRRATKSPFSRGLARRGDSLTKK